MPQIATLSIGNLYKKESFSALFYNAINNIDYGKLFVTVEADAKLLNVFPTSAAGVIDFVFFAPAVRALNLHLLLPPVRHCIHKGADQGSL